MINESTPQLITQRFLKQEAVQTVSEQIKVFQITRRQCCIPQTVCAQIGVCLKVQLVVGQAFLGADEIAHCVDAAQSKK